MIVTLIFIVTSIQAEKQKREKKPDKTIGSTDKSKDRYTGVPTQKDRNTEKESNKKIQCYTQRDVFRTEYRAFSRDVTADMLES